MKKTFIGLGLAITVAFLAYGLFLTVSRAPWVPPLPLVATTTQSLTLAGGVVSLSYPALYGLAVTGEQILTHPYIPPCDAPFDYCVYRIGNEYASTTFESAGIRIRRRPDLGTESACLTTRPAGFTGLVPARASAPDYSASVFSPVSGAATGHYAEGALYRLYARGACTEFETRIGESQFANYPPGTIERFTDADRANVRDELRAILGSVAVLRATVIFPTLPATAGVP